MVLHMENACQKKYLLEICQRNYFVCICPSLIVAYAVNFFQLSRKYRQIEVVGNSVCII
jgi:hypothetical protein